MPLVRVVWTRVCRRVRELEIRVTAQQVVADRRKPSMLAAPTASSAHGVFKWAEEPAAGARVLLAYNKSYGLLARGTSVRVHVGYDGWWNKSTQVRVCVCVAGRIGMSKSSMCLGAY